MLVFYTLADIERRLTEAFIVRYRRKDVALTGVLLARPEDKIAKDDILPHLEYWHYRSDYFTDFFCAGFVPMDRSETARDIGVEIKGEKWGFSIEAFDVIINYIEKKTGWRYNGDPCLILANAYFDGSSAHLDFKRSIRINFRDAVKEKAISTPTALVDTVFEFAKAVNEGSADPVWELSDTFGRKLIGRGLKDAFFAWLPKWLRSTAKAGVHFVVHEVGDQT